MFVNQNVHLKSNVEGRKSSLINWKAHFPYSIESFANVRHFFQLKDSSAKKSKNIILIIIVDESLKSLKLLIIDFKTLVFIYEAEWLCSIILTEEIAQKGNLQNENSCQLLAAVTN